MCRWRTCSRPDRLPLRNRGVLTIGRPPKPKPKPVPRPAPDTPSLNAVESLSLHRSLTFDHREGAQRESVSEQAAAADAAGPNFEQSILGNLAKAGIQNGRRNERITFATLDSYPGRYLQAVGERSGSDDDDATPGRVGIVPRARAAA